MGYYVVANTNTLSDLYITSTENEAKLFKYNYEYTHYGTHCKIKYIEQKFEEFPKVLYVEAAGLTTINVVSNEIESSYNWIYNYKPLDEHLKETDEYILSKENVKILKKEINENTRVILTPGRFEGVEFNYEIMAILDLIRLKYFQQYYL